MSPHKLPWKHLQRLGPFPSLIGQLISIPDKTDTQTYTQPETVGNPRSPRAAVASSGRQWVFGEIIHFICGLIKSEFRGGWPIDYYLCASLKQIRSWRHDLKSYDVSITWKTLKSEPAQYTYRLTQPKLRKIMFINMVTLTFDLWPWLIRDVVKLNGSANRANRSASISK